MTATSLRAVQKEMPAHLTTGVLKNNTARTIWRFGRRYLLDDERRRVPEEGALRKVTAGNEKVKK
jgi:hypothetical protein